MRSIQISSDSKYWAHTHNSDTLWFMSRKVGVGAPKLSRTFSDPNLPSMFVDSNTVSLYGITCNNVHEMHPSILEKEPLLGIIFDLVTNC